MKCLYCGDEIMDLAETPATEQISFLAYGGKPAYSYHTRCDRPMLEGSVCSSRTTPLSLDDLDRLGLS